MKAPSVITVWASIVMTVIPLILCLIIELESLTIPTGYQLVNTNCTRSSICFKKFPDTNIVMVVSMTTSNGNHSCTFDANFLFENLSVYCPDRLHRTRQGKLDLNIRGSRRFFLLQRFLGF